VDRPHGCRKRRKPIGTGVVNEDRAAGVTVAVDALLPKTALEMLVVSALEMAPPFVALLPSNVRQTPRCRRH
jgi:hypothetical protein